MAIAVGKGQPAQFNLVGNEDHGVAMQLIGGVQGRHRRFAFHFQCARQVHLIEGACEEYTTIGMTCDMAEEGVRKVMHEVDIGLMGVDIKGDGIVLGRYKAIDIRKDSRPVVGLGIDVNLLLLLVPEHEGMQDAHASPFKLEIVDIQAGMAVEIIKERLDDGLSRGFAAELHGIEIHQVQDILHLHLVQVYRQRVTGVLAGSAIDGDMLLLVVHVEVVDQQVVLRIEDIRWLHVPDRIVEDDMRGLYADMGL